MSDSRLMSLSNKTEPKQGLTVAETGLNKEILKGWLSYPSSYSGRVSQ